MTFAELIYTQVIPFIDGYVIQGLYALAFIFFVYGMFKFFFTGGAENREKGKQFAVWGIVGIVVLFSVWGLVQLLLSSVFPRGAFNQDPRINLLPSGAVCESSTQCRSGVCTIRGLYTSTCE